MAFLGVIFRGGITSLQREETLSFNHIGFRLCLPNLLKSSSSNSDSFSSVVVGWLVGWLFWA